MLAEVLDTARVAENKKWNIHKKQFIGTSYHVQNISKSTKNKNQQQSLRHQSETENTG